MKEIQISKSFKKVLVDSEDYEMLSQYIWLNQKGYARAFIAGERVYMHRLLTGCVYKDRKVVDHIDENTFNCQRSNLRVVTHAQNLCNRKSKDNTTSKYLGVYYDKERCKWRASITSNYKEKMLGRFDNEKDAAIAYNVAALKIHGEYARINILI